MRTNKQQKRAIKRGVSAYDEALYYLTPKQRTVREVENHLDEANYAEGEIMQTIDRLKANGLLNDEKYAADFIESRLNTKPVSRQKLRDQLMGHFIPEELINEALSAVTDEVEAANARAVAKKYYRQFALLDDEERLRRVGLRLVSRGYSYDTVKSTLEVLPDIYDDADTADIADDAEELE